MEAILSAVPHEYVEPLGTKALPMLPGTPLRPCASARIVKEGEGATVAAGVRGDGVL